jgi:transposase-like protein
MNITSIYKRFPTEADCTLYLEEKRWKGSPKCPYCESTKCTPLPKQQRHHCNNCNTSFSVTVRTIFHRSHLPLQTWFLAVSLVLNAKKGLSARQLSRDLEVNKDTAWSMAMRIRRALVDDRELLTGIVEMDETYVGGKPRPGGGGYNKRGRGTKKTPVLGVVERGGKVRAKVSTRVDYKTLRTFLKESVDLSESSLITDQHGGYIRMKEVVDHRIINHRMRYVNGDIHTNNIESFWAIVKRGMTGQYHKVSLRYLPRYMDEFCYRFNYRKEDSGNLFEATIDRAIGGDHV